ncbi:hypothetical protein FOA52_009934 [Chlamydomonas sp. UWO 241]|nr:hypothetical protein FOA52_009934 [Chlamydomonas sp. UWO 241]
MGVSITLELLRRRAEHNEGMVSTMEEVALHQSNLETIDATLGQLCPRLKIVYLQSNLISKIQNLHKLKEMEYLNLAINNVSKLQNLQKCEALNKLDLTMNFVPKAGLLTVCSLQANEHLKELFLMGNPCADWQGYRQYVIATIPKLQRLDGVAIKHSERITSCQALPQLEVQLRQELIAEGVDPDSAALIEDDSIFDDNGEVKETGYVDEKGEMRRPWCPATRILEHRENERLNAVAESKKKAGQSGANLGDTGPSQKARRHDFDALPEGERVWQKNEGEWDFSMEEDEAGANIVLEVDVGKYLDTSLIKVDVQPTFIRLLIKGRLLQLHLPCEVRTGASAAQRSNASGRLAITMPKEDPSQPVHNVAAVRPRVAGTTGAAAPGAGGGGGGSAGAVGAAGRGGRKEVREAEVTALEEDDDDFVPDLRMDEEEATAAAAERIAAAAEDGTSLPVRLATDVVRFLYGGTGRREPADGGVVSASLLNAKPAVGGIGVEPRGGGVLRVLFTVASDAVADTVVRWRHELRRCVDSTAVFDVLSDREEAQHQALWPAFLAAKEDKGDPAAQYDECDEDAMLAAQNFKYTPGELIKMAKDVLKGGFAKMPDALASDFQFLGPVVGPLAKEPFLKAINSFDLAIGFPDMKNSFHHFRCDPFVPGCVWLTSRTEGTHTGVLAGSIQPTGKHVVCPPQAISLTFNEEGKVIKFTVGVTLDRTQGNTGGLGGVFGLFYAVGSPLPFPEAQPWKMSKRYRFFQALGRMAEMFKGGGK